MANAKRDYQTYLIESLKDPEEAAAYLTASYAEAEDAKDHRVFLLALRNVAEAHGFAKLAEEAGLNRETLYRTLSDRGNPGLASLTGLLRALDLGITFTPLIKAA